MRNMPCHAQRELLFWAVLRLAREGNRTDSYLDRTEPNPSCINNILIYLIIIYSTINDYIEILHDDTVYAVNWQHQNPIG
jgi:hypothetical protein